MSSNPYAAGNSPANTKLDISRNQPEPWLLSITSAGCLAGLASLFFFGGSMIDLAGILIHALPCIAAASALACITRFRRGPRFPLIISKASLALSLLYGLLMLWALFFFELPAQQ